MLFTKPNKVSEGNYLKSTCPDIKIENSESLESFENEIIVMIAENSLGWFNKSFTLDQIKNKYTKKTFESGLVVKGLLFYKDKFVLETEVSEPEPEPEQDFFEEVIEPVLEQQVQESQVQEQVSETIQVPEMEPESEPQVQVPVQIEHIHQEEGEVEDQKPKKNYCTIAKQIKDKLKQAIDDEDLEKALKLSQILSQLNSK